MAHLSEPECSVSACTCRPPFLLRDWSVDASPVETLPLHSCEPCSTWKECVVCKGAHMETVPSYYCCGRVSSSWESLLRCPHFFYVYALLFRMAAHVPVVLHQGNQALSARAASMHLPKHVRLLPTVRSVEFLAFRLSRPLLERDICTLYPWWHASVFAPFFSLTIRACAWHLSSQFVLKHWFVKQSPGVVDQFLPSHTPSLFSFL